MTNKETLYKKALENSISGNISEAKKLAEQILETDPGNSKANYLLGLILFEHMSNPERALNHARTAISNDPSNPLGYYLYCDILIADRNMEDVKTISDEVVNLDPVDKSYIYHKLACAYESRRQFITAINTLRKSKDKGTSNNWGTFVDNEILRISRKYVKNLSMNYTLV